MHPLTRTEKGHLDPDGDSGPEKQATAPCDAANVKSQGR